MPRKAVPVPNQLRARILELHSKGVGRNEIARVCEVSTARVSRVVHGAGETFDPRNTELATRNRVADLAERRALLADRLIDEAHVFVDKLHSPYRAFNFGGKDNTYEEHELPEAPVDAVRALMQSVQVAAKTSLDLTRFDSDNGAAQAGNLLSAIASGLGEAARLLDAQDDTGV